MANNQNVFIPARALEITRAKLQSDPEVAERALVKLLDMTIARKSDPKKPSGFDMCDISSIALIAVGIKYEKLHLTENQFEFVSPKLGKYAAKLLRSVEPAKLAAFCKSYAK